jgi:hypothetical protein
VFMARFARTYLNRQSQIANRKLIDETKIASSEMSLCKHTT